MQKETKRTHTLRIIVELAFLALFGFLFFRGSIQLWLGVFVAGALLSLVFWAHLLRLDMPHEHPLQADRMAQEKA